MAEHDEQLGIKEEIVCRQSANPFVPFVILTTGGTRYEGNNSGLIAVGQSVLHRMHPHSDRYDVIRINQIASLVVAEPAAN
jgi:hypothetical protein